MSYEERDEEFFDPTGAAVMITAIIFGSGVVIGVAATALGFWIF